MSLRILAWDIERIPASGYHWGLFQQNIGLAQLIQPGETVSFAARWVGEPKKNAVFYSTFHHGKQEMLDAAWELHNEADALLSWNGAGFDTRHMNTEWLLRRMTPPSEPKEIDLMRAAKNRFKFLSNKLDFVSEQLGYGRKLIHEGFPMWLKVMQNDPKAWEKFRRYNLHDVHLLMDIYKDMRPWIRNHPNVNLYGGEGCPACGSKDTQKRGPKPAQVFIYQQYWCKSCGKWYRGSKSIGRTEYV